jgi:hypothetical protein
MSIRTRREHRRLRRAAEHRRTTAQRDATRTVRGLRRDAETAAITARANLAELAAAAITRLATHLRRPRTEPYLARRTTEPLARLARRVAAFDGLFEVDSPAGGPTVVTVTMPCE